MELEVQNLDVGYDALNVSQRRLSFSLAAGQVCCVLGPNGCGKSTLFSTLLGYLPPRSGRVVVRDGDDVRDVAAMRPSERAELMAYVAQRHQPPFPYPVRDVVEMGLVNRVGLGGRPSGADARLVEDAMLELGIWDFRDEPYTQLSGGELQLALIARAMVQQARFILMDEPTAALDYGNEVKVIEQVRTLAESGVGVLMTTHNPDHAFLLDADVVLLSSADRPRVGRCWDVITDAAMHAAYDTDVYRVAYETRSGKTMYLCVPDLGEQEED